MDRMTKKAMLMGMGAIAVIGMSVACLSMKTKIKNKKFNIDCLSTDYNEL